MNPYPILWSERKHWRTPPTGSLQELSILFQVSTSFYYVERKEPLGASHFDIDHWGKIGRVGRDLAAINLS